MRDRFTVAFMAAVLGALAIGGVVTATPSVGLTSTTIVSGTLDAVNLNIKNGPWKIRLRTKGQSSVSVVENDVDPGGSFGWHSHPGPSLIIVKSGTLTFYNADDPSCKPEVFSAGEAFIDSGQDTHIGRNEGTVKAVSIVTRFLPLGAAPRIDEPDPGNCSF